MAQWFYRKDKEECGPVSSAELKRLAEARVIHPESSVRSSEWMKWHRASSIEGLFPPSIPVTQQAMSPQQEDDDQVGNVSPKLSSESHGSVIPKGDAWKRTSLALIGLSVAAVASVGLNLWLLLFQPYFRIMELILLALIGNLLYFFGREFTAKRSHDRWINDDSPDWVMERDTRELLEYIIKERQHGRLTDKDKFWDGHGIIVKLVGWDAPKLNDCRNWLVNKGWTIGRFQGGNAMISPDKHQALKVFGDPYSISYGDTRLVLYTRPHGSKMQSALTLWPEVSQLENFISVRPVSKATEPTKRGQDESDAVFAVALFVLLAVMEISAVASGWSFNEIMTGPRGSHHPMHKSRR